MCFATNFCKSTLLLGGFNRSRNIFSVDISLIGILNSLYKHSNRDSFFLDKLDQRLRSVFHLRLLSYTKGRFFRSVSDMVSINVKPKGGDPGHIWGI